MRVQQNGRGKLHPHAGCPGGEWALLLLKLRCKADPGWGGTDPVQKARRTAHAKHTNLEDMTSCGAKRRTLGVHPRVAVGGGPTARGA
eukprot:2762193-Amphidinium_carterae.1